MKIAIIKLSSLGDIIHAMIVLQFIKKRYPEAQIDWIVDYDFKDILVNNPDINTIIPLKIKFAKRQQSFKLLFSELKRLRKLAKYDFVIDMQGLLKSAIIARLIPTKIIAGFDKNSIREKLASLFYTKKIAINYAENIINRNTFLLQQAINIKINDNDIFNKKPFLFFNNQNFNLSKVKKNIILVLGASFKAKIYPVEKYAKIVENIDANFIAIWGNNNELKMVKKLKNLQTKTIISSKLDLNKLKALISQVDLIIGGDTGPTHMAWGLNIPSITLFGATPANRNTLVNNINKTIDSNSKVDCLNINKNDFSIDTIDIIEIIKISRHLLSVNF